VGLEINAFRHFSDAEVQAIFTWAKAGFDTSNLVIKTAASGEVTVQKDWLVDRDAFWNALNWRLDQISSNAAARRVTRTSIRYV
jgi:hypothetical protein